MGNGVRGGILRKAGYSTVTVRPGAGGAAPVCPSPMKMSEGLRCYSVGWCETVLVVDQLFC